MMRFRSVVILVGIFFAGCGPLKNTFGGSEEAVSVANIVRNLRTSDNLILTQLASATVAGAPVTTIANQRDISSGYFPLRLDAEAGASANRQQGWLEFSTTTAGREFRADATVTHTELGFAMVIEGSSTGIIFGDDPDDNTVQTYVFSLSSGVATLKFLSDTSNYYTRTFPSVPSSGAVVVVGSVNADGSMELLVNGQPGTATVTTGSPLTPFSLARRLTLGPASAGQIVKLYGAYFFKTALSKSELGALTLVLSSEFSVSGVNLDSAYVPVEDDNGADPRYELVKPVLANNCVQCHIMWSGANSDFFVQSGLAVPGDPDLSSLYYRLKGSPSANGPKDMPKSGTVDSASRDLIRDWIQNMAQ